MAKSNKSKKNNHALPKVDEEFAEESANGLEQVAVKAQRKKPK